MRLFRAQLGTAQARASVSKPDSPETNPTGYRIAFELDLMPSPEFMGREGVTTLEEWFRWAEQWVMALKFYGGMKKSSQIMEIGCGLGRIAYPLRHELLTGTYDGFDICSFKIDFLRAGFQARYPHFRFFHADVHNTQYNPGGRLTASDFQFPYGDRAFDIVFAASVFTHLVPASARNYLRQISRVLRPRGCAVISAFLLDYFDPHRPRPLGMARHYFDFLYYPDPNYGDSFAVSDPKNLEAVSAYRAAVLLKFAKDAGLELLEPPIPGIWSGATENFVLPQDLLVLQRRD
jgi:SAM-dependent methyltransferase